MTANSLTVVLCLTLSCVPAIGPAQVIDETIPVDSIASAAPSLAPSLTLGVYVDAYYARYSSDAAASVFQPFATAGPRDNAIGLDIAELGLAYTTNRVRAELTFHAGDIPRGTWSPDFENVQQAHAGIRLGRGLWLDAGFFRTHVGTESFLPKLNHLSQTAYVTYNEPFYQAGARLALDCFADWTLELWVVNGYNRFVDNNSAKSVGLLASHRLSPKLTLTYTNLLGRESPDDASAAQWRVYQNAYVGWEQGRNSVTVGADYGVQTKTADLTGSTFDLAQLWAALATYHRQVGEEFSLTGRVETYNDPRGFVSGIFTDSSGERFGTRLAALSIGGEYRPSPGSYLRAEGRYTENTNGATRYADGRSRQLALLLTLGLELSHELLRP